MPATQPSPAAVLEGLDFGTQDPGDDDSDLGSGAISPKPDPQPPKPGNPSNSMAVNTLEQDDPDEESIHVADYLYRYYDPLTGRWPSRDPIGERGGVNLYGFVGNLPINSFDVLGNIWFIGWAVERATYELDKTCLGCCLVGGVWSLTSEKCRESYSAVIRYGTSFSRDFNAEFEADTAFGAEMEAVDRAFNEAKKFQAPNCFKFKNSITVFQDSMQIQDPPII